MSINKQTTGGQLEHLKELGLNPKTIIDVGIAYGTAGLYEVFEDTTYLLIEPLEEYEENCKEIVEKYGGEYVIAAASDKDGTISINVHPDLSGSSIFDETEGKHVDGTPRNVPTVRIDALCREKQLKGPFIIKSDTQGAELLVVEGADEILDETEAILMEAFMFQFYKNTPKFSEVINFMEEKGFVVYDIFGSINRPLDNALGQVDLVFVKENGMFRKTHNFATPEQREEFKRKRIEQLKQKHF